MTDLDGQTRWEGWPEPPAPRDPWQTLAEVEAGLRAVLTRRPSPVVRPLIEDLIDLVTDARKERA